jgi:F420-dependent oxidoreductase-like protein
MRIGINGGGHHTSLGAIRDEARAAARDGFASYWLSQINGPDALTALAVVGAETPGIELGTAIIPTYPRHPIALAMQALTVQAATGGRLVLGIGPSHRVAVEGAWGLSYTKPLAHTREYVAVLRDLLQGKAVSFAGEQLVARGQLAIDAEACPVLLAALGPRMLELAGTAADGTVTWMAGARTLRDHIVPAVVAAAQKAGRGRPRVVAGLPICVTDDAAGARAHAAEKLGVYGTLPAYRAMLEREGVAGPEGVLLAGDEAEVRDGVAALAAAGVTDLRASVLCANAEEALRTRALLRSMLPGTEARA